MTPRKGAALVTDELLPFAANYREARERFLAACRRRGVAVVSKLHPERTGLVGEPLSIDTAWLGPRDAPNVLLSICGTHGVEGYPGSAIQTEWLDNGNQIPPGTAVLLVHSLNPWGWSRESQLNEDGIDLNRNFIAFDPVPPAGEFDQPIAQALEISKLDWNEVTSAIDRLRDLAARVGESHLATAFAKGQYSNPAGPKFGGRSPAWSNRALREIVDVNLQRTRRLFALDWHTGLGAWGETFELCFSPPQSRAWHTTAQAWGEANVRRGQHDWGMNANHSARAIVESGLAECAITDRFPDIAIAGGAVEFGTWPIDDILAALVIDRWLAEHPNDRAASRWRAQMRTLFSPREPDWEAEVLRRGLAMFDSSLVALSAWHDE